MLYSVAAVELPSHSGQMLYWNDILTRIFAGMTILDASAKVLNMLPRHCNPFSSFTALKKQIWICLDSKPEKLNRHLKTTNPIIVRSLLGVTTLGTILLASLTAPAANILQTVNQNTVDNNGWASAIWGTPAAVATAGNNYEVPNGFTERTPNSATPPAFAGDSLKIDSGGTLFLKHGANADSGPAIVHLILAGGVMRFSGSGTGTNSTLGGTIQVTADSQILDPDQTGNHNINLLSDISGSGNLLLFVQPATNAVFLAGNNSGYSGNWTNTGFGSLQVVGGTTNPFGSGMVTVSAGTSLIFASTNNMILDNVITGAGSVVKRNTNSVTVNAINTVGAVTVSGGILKLGASTSLTNASTISLTGGTLDPSLIGGLTLVNTQAMPRCVGTVSGNLTASTANTLNFNLTSATNDVLNVAGSLTLNGNPTLSLSLSAYKDTGVYRLINYSGTIQGGGSFTLVPPAGSAETFALDTSTPGQVNLIVTAFSKSITWVGDGFANAWDTASFNWSGPTNFATGDSVTFDDAGSYPVDVSVAVSPGRMTVNNSSQTCLFYDLGISCSGLLTKDGTGELDLSNPGNNFTGPIDIRGGVFSIGNGGSFGSLGLPSAITNNGVFRVNLNNNGLGFSSPISGSGSVELMGSSSLVMSGTNSYTGLTTINDGCQLHIGSPSGLGSTSSGTIILPNGRLGVNSFVGSMTVPEPLTVSGTGIAAAPGALYVFGSGNNITWSGPVTVAGDSRFRVRDSNVRMNFSNTVLGTNVAFQCTVGSDPVQTDTGMTFQNTLSLGSSGSFTVDGYGFVALSSSSNYWSTTTINGGTLLVNGQLNGGTVTVNSTATLGGSGSIVGPVSVMDGGTLAPGNAGTGTLTLNNTLSLAASSTTLMRLNRTNTQKATLLAAAAIPFSGTLTVTNIGPALQVGDTFNLFDGTISGTFSATNLPTLSSTNYYWDTTLLQSQGIIKVASSMAPTPTITVPAVTGGNFTFQVANSASGFNYVLEAAASLAPAAWSDIQTNAGTGGTLTFTLPMTPGDPHRFFRISVR